MQPWKDRDREMMRKASRTAAAFALVIGSLSAAYAVEITILSDKGDEISCSKHLPGIYDADKDGKTVVNVPEKAFDDLFTVAYYRGKKWAAYAQVKVVVEDGKPTCRIYPYPNQPRGDWRLTAEPLTISCTGWKLRFSDTFERPDLGDAWRILQGEWVIEKGWLRGSGMIMCTRKFDDAQRLEFNAKSDEPCDLSGIICAGADGYSSGYFLGFGSEENTFSKLLVRGKLVERADAVITPGKVHHIVCRRDGHRITLHVDGEQVFNYLDARPLCGNGHRQIGLYMWFEGEVDNVKVYTRPDVVRPAAAASPALGRPASNPNLLGNAGFETLHPRYPSMPNEWTVRPWSRDARAELVTDPAAAHSGLRYMRLFAPTSRGIRLDALPGNQGLRLNPGQSYDIIVWARTEPDAKRAELIVEPGRHTAALTKEWKEYRFAYTHPAGAKPLLGLYVRVLRGPIGVDDVAIVASGRKPTPPSTPERATKPRPSKPGDVRAVLFKGSGMWFLPTVEKVLPTDSVPLKAHEARIAAARNEAESFQILIEAADGLPGVTLSMTDLTGKATKSLIPAANVKFDLVDTVYYPVTGPGASRASGTSGMRAGLYPDPIVPWRRRDIAPGERKTALVTLRVPKDSHAGEYLGTIRATSTNSIQIDMPLVLEVFDFTLADRLTFEPVFWADNFGGIARKGGVIPPERRKFYSRHNPDGSVLALAKMLAEHHGTPFYSHHDKSPYAVPWHWDPKAEQATFDFTWLDRNAKIILEECGAAYLCFGGKFRPAGRRSGNVWDWNRDLNKAWTQGGGEMALHQHMHPLDSDEGKKMYRAYCEGIAKHLREKGWLERSFVYVCDETDPGKPSETVEWCAKTARKAGFKTFAAASAWAWPVYLSEIDAFAGPLSPKSLERLKKDRQEWWGRYNRPCGVTDPLANARLIGADSFFRGTPHYCAYFAYIPEIWIDARDMSGVAANAGYPSGEFVARMGYDHGFATWVYPFPAWELKSAGAPEPLYASSLRLEALREGVEDYEYLKLVQQIGRIRQTPEQSRNRVSQLLGEMQKLIKESAIGTKGYDPFSYRIDGRQYYELRCEIGREISRAFSRTRRRPK